jgi:hypothetical protein
MGHCKSLTCESMHLLPVQYIHYGILIKVEAHADGPGQVCRVLRAPAVHLAVMDETPGRQVPPPRAQVPSKQDTVTWSWGRGTLISDLGLDSQVSSLLLQRLD